jgi:TRAP-type mannitol/chloroaromatic compound transport system permease large subunit
LFGPIFITLAITIVLLAAGVWVGVGLGVSGVFGLLQVLGLHRSLDIVGTIVWEQNTNFVLLAIPMFILMGELLFHSGLMSKVYLRAATVVTGLPGGLLQANIFACTIFAACSGSSVA